jgi:hypothetical protein
MKILICETIGVYRESLKKSAQQINNITFCIMARNPKHICSSDCEHRITMTMDEYNLNVQNGDYEASIQNKLRPRGPRFTDAPTTEEIQLALSSSDNQSKTPPLKNSGERAKASPSKVRPGERCNRCHKRGHVAADCREKQSKHGAELVQSALSDEAQKQLGLRDAKIEKIEEQLAKVKEKLDKSKADEAKMNEAFSRINVPIEIRAPSGLVVEGFNIKPEHQDFFLNNLIKHYHKINYWILFTGVFTVMMALLILTTMFMTDHINSHEACTWIEEIQHLILTSLRPSYWFMSIIMRFIYKHAPLIVSEWLYDIFFIEHAIHLSLSIFVSLMAVYFSLRDQKKAAWVFMRIRAEYLERDTADFKKMKVANWIRWLQDNGYIKVVTTSIMTHWINMYIDEHSLFELKHAAITIFYLLKMTFAAPVFLFIIWPLHIFCYLQTFYVDSGILMTRDYYHDDDFADKEMPSLIRDYNLVRVLNISQPSAPFVNFDARADLQALSELKHIDPLYATASMSYERPTGVRIKFKNEYIKKMSLELFMQLTTPHIVNLLDREEDVKFRLNRSSVNFHGVNVDKFQHLCGEDIVNTTLDCVYHYYKSRKWAYCQSCPEELFYTLPAC